MILYKYISEPFGTKALETGLVRFTQPAALNDPFEGQPLFGEIVTPEQLDALVDFLLAETNYLETYMDQWVSQYYDNADPKEKAGEPREIAIPRIRATLAAELAGNRESFERVVKARMQQNRPSIQSNAASQVVQAMQDHLGVLSLSAVNDDPRLWGLYADSQSGIAIGFDSDDAFLNGLLKVQYVSERPRISVSSEVQSKEEGRGVAEAIISTKGTEWEFEQEYRVVRSAQGDAQNQDRDGRGFPVYLFGFPTTAIREVIIGNRMRNDREEHLRSVLAEPRYKHVRLGKIDLSGSLYKLTIRWIDNAPSA